MVTSTTLSAQITRREEQHTQLGPVGQPPTLFGYKVTFVTNGDVRPG